MATRKQIASNRRNCGRSTGPKTPAGKAASSLNAVKHGLLARDTVLPGEDRAQFDATLTGLTAEYRPHGPVEDFLVRQMASAQWRLSRLNRIETGLLTVSLERIRQAYPIPIDPFGGREEIVICGPGAADAPPFSLPDPEAEYLATTRLLGLTFHHDSPAARTYSTLARYEGTLRRSFFRALSELESRRGAAPPKKQKLRNEASSALSRPRRRRPG